jgi:hypothetical protein
MYSDRNKDFVDRPVFTKSCVKVDEQVERGVEELVGREIEGATIR